MKGDSLACVRISGNVPGSTAAGTNNLSIKVRAYLSNLSSTNVVLNALLSAAYPTHKLDTLVSLDYYKIIIDPQPCFPQSVQNLEQFGFHLVGCAPNPFNTQTKIQFETAETKTLEVRILNAVGQVVSQRSIKAQKGQNYITFDASSWKAGLYTCVLSDGQHNQSIKMIMQ